MGKAVARPASGKCHREEMFARTSLFSFGTSKPVMLSWKPEVREQREAADWHIPYPSSVVFTAWR